MTDLATLVVRMEAQTAQFQASLDKANKKLGRFEKDTKRAIGGIQRSFTQLRRTATGFAAAFGAGFIANKFIQNTKAQQDAIAQLNASLKSTGGVAGRSADQLIANAAALQKVSTFGDEAVIKMQSVLLTFTQIRGVNFDRATASVLDLSAKLGTDLNSAALQVGKALNDPVLGVTALSRAGIQFSEDQKKLIKSLTETGQVAKAQEIILAELETQFGGSAKAARDTLGGALASLSNAFNDLFELSTEATGGVVTEVNKLTDTLSDPKIKQSADLLGAAIVRSLGFAIEVAAKLVTSLQSIGEEIARIIGGTNALDVGQYEEDLQELIKAQDNFLTQGREKPVSGFATAFAPEAAAAQFVFEQLQDEEKTLKDYEQRILAAAKRLADARKLALEFGAFDGTSAASTAGGSSAAGGEEVAQQQNKLAILKQQTAESKLRYLVTMQEFELGERFLEQEGERLALARQVTNIGQYQVVGPMTESLRQQALESAVRYNETMKEFAENSEWLAAQEENFTQLEEFGKQAARNIQTAFADFLFDPFSDGIKGMLKGFIDLIRRMVAELAAKQILTAFFGFLGQQGGFLGSLGGSLLKGLETRAAGGPVRSNSAYLVGEKGPELLVGAAGKVIPGTDMGGGGSMTIAPTYNIDARGATQELVKQLPSILAVHAQKTVEMARRAINEDISRGALARA